jgi:uncharacterized protein
MRGYRWAVAVAATAASISPSAASAGTGAGTLSVEGSGSVFVAPDVADLSVSVTRSAASSTAALSAASGTTGTVIGAIRLIGVPAGGIQTEGVNVASRIVRVGKDKHRQRQWTASESIDIHVTNLKIVGSVIDGATKAGASTVSGATFSFSDPSAGIVAATRAAIADARRRANDAAAALGYRVTGVRSVQLDPQSPVEPFARAAPSASTAPSTPTTIHPGTQEVDAEVEIVYTISRA